MGKDDKKGYVISLRLPAEQEFKVDLKQMAEDQDRSVNGLIVSLVKRELEKYRKERETQKDLFKK